MDIVTVKMDFPKDVLLAADISEANASVDIKKYLALFMFKERLLSFGKASEMSGMDKMKFMEFAGSRGIPLNYDESDYNEDLIAISGLGL
jgi:predicted HTH domain antitoxin